MDGRAPAVKHCSVYETRGEGYTIWCIRTRYGVRLSVVFKGFAASFHSAGVSALFPGFTMHDMVYEKVFH